MKKIMLTLLLSVVTVHGGFSWGFFGHKMINKLAVFTLPENLLLFYKTNIEFITEHAVDPDRRRYTMPEEASRHYLDLDHYEQALPIDSMPLFWKDASAKYSEDTLKAYGIVPWYINTMRYRLTEAFKRKDIDKILKLSADIGHYVADAHVPLHASENYNGQLTGQTGIHGFWESRLPELFSEQYDFFVGRAYYIHDPLAMAWEAVSGSFAAKDSVLLFERKLNESFPSDQKYVLEQKGQTQAKNYAHAYAKAYHDMLGNQVERRMRASILAVGCIWYTCWVDAGQPDLAAGTPSMPEKMEEKEPQSGGSGRMIGRDE